MTIDEKKLSEEDIHLLKIKEILLKEDREELSKLRNRLEDEEAFNKRITPYIEKHIEDMKVNFPDQYNVMVSRIFEEKLKDSRQEMIDMLAPSIGIMIKKFISMQFESLKESIDNQVKNTFSTKSWKNKFKSVFYGVKESDLILKEMDKYQIQEIYLIQRNSGLLFGSASKSINLDQDVIAGMLTAIKSFAEDAFQQGEQDLDMIEYGTYKILMQNFKTYYLALAITGSLSAADKDEISNIVLSFADRYLGKSVHDIDEKIINEYSKYLEEHFINTNA